MKNLFLFSLVALFGISFASAGGTYLTINTKTFGAYIDEIPTINVQLSNCKILIPSSGNSIVGDGNLLGNVNLNDCTTSNFFVTILNLDVTKFTNGMTLTFTYQATLSDDFFNKILGSTSTYQ